VDRLHSIQVFVKVADCGGFAAAARDLAMSPPAVTRAVAMLEDRLGTRLFVRTTRSVREYCLSCGPLSTIWSRASGRIRLSIER
jgi:hypothetical protein